MLLTISNEVDGRAIGAKHVGTGGSRESAPRRLSYWLAEVNGTGINFSLLPWEGPSIKAMSGS